MPSDHVEIEDTRAYFDLIIEFARVGSQDEEILAMYRLMDDVVDDDPLQASAIQHQLNARVHSFVEARLVEASRPDLRRAMARLPVQRLAGWLLYKVYRGEIDVADTSACREELERSFERETRSWRSRRDIQPTPPPTPEPRDSLLQIVTRYLRAKLGK